MLKNETERQNELRKAVQDRIRGEIEELMNVVINERREEEEGFDDVVDEKLTEVSEVQSPPREEGTTQQPESSYLATTTGPSSEFIAEWKKTRIKKAVSMSIADFQLGVESNQAKINLATPHQSLLSIKDYPLYMILEVPEFGVVYQNSKGEK